MKRRNRIRRCRNRGLTRLPGRVRGLPEGCPSGIRRVGGAKLNRALVRNVRTCRSDVKGEVSSGYNREGQSTDAEHRGGAARSRVEGPVKGLDRRGCIAQPKPRANWEQEEPWDEERPLAYAPLDGHHEPYDARVSRTDLGAPGGEIPPGDSTTPVLADIANGVGCPR